MWHAYKYTLIQVFRTHFSFFSFLLRGTLAEGDQVPPTLPLRSLEMLMAAVLRLA